VPLVESGLLDGSLVEDVVRSSLEPFLDGGQEIDTLLLGCTHYPLLGPVIRRVIGPEMTVIDTASATASALAGLLEIHSLGADASRAAQHVQLTTGDVAQFESIARPLFNDEFANVERVAVVSAV
jgi:glutamate racemase